MQLAKHVSLTDPEAVLRFIASKQVSNARKELLITAYERWLRLQGLKVKLAKPRREERLPYARCGAFKTAFRRTILFVCI